MVMVMMMVMMIMDDDDDDNGQSVKFGRMLHHTSGWMMHCYGIIDCI